MSTARRHVEGRGGSWLLAEPDDVAWIVDGTTVGTAIDSAIPPLFPAYATVVNPDEAHAFSAAGDALLRHLRAHSTDERWWLGYLETGASDVVFPHAPRLLLYARWPYVVVRAGPDEAGTWRTPTDGMTWHGGPPDLIWPEDRSWLVSQLWDDDWWCVGGSEDLVADLVADPHLDARAVRPGEEATPPGFAAR